MFSQKRGKREENKRFQNFTQLEPETRNLNPPDSTAGFNSQNVNSQKQNAGQNIYQKPERAVYLVINMGKYEINDKPYQVKY